MRANLEFILARLPKERFKMGNFLFKLKFIKLMDVLAFFPFLIALPISWIYRIKRNNLWLVCERSKEARDNGYWFFKYMIENHPEQDCVYAIKRNSPDYNKVASLGGQIIEFGSLKHWIYYLTAKINISSQKEGKPNAAVCYLLEIYGLRKNKRVYLKHGIVHNDLKWHYYDVTKMWLYVCSAKREYEFCKSFGYTDENMALTGLCRFDNLNDEIRDKKCVFIMPTSREWIAHPIKDYRDIDDIYHFTNTEYYKAWGAVLENEQFNTCIEENDLEVVFFLHPTMQQFSGDFLKLKTKATIKMSQDVDLQYMLKKASLLITDYSSIFFDFGYMRKPMLFYQFDYDKFRTSHYQEGYFSYKRDGFGAVCETTEQIVKSFLEIANEEMNISEKYLDRINSFFLFNDNMNSERVYRAIKQKIDKEESNG